MLRSVPVVLLFASASSAGDREAVVRADEAVLLAGPDGGSPETMRLGRGQRVRVISEDGSYFVVRAPAGSIAWVRGAYLRFVPERPTTLPAAAVVDANGQAKLRPGRLNEPKPLLLERTGLPDGTAVTVVGPKVEIDGVKWYPIIAPEDDVRYVAKSAIEIGGTVPVAVGPATIGRGGMTTAEQPRWQEAQAAERSGDTVRAEALYLELARDMQKPGGSDAVAEACFARVHELRQKRKPSGVEVATARPRSEPRDRPEPRAERAEAAWVGPGVLYGSSLRVNGQKVYALQSTSQTVLTYVLPGPGIDLASRTGKLVRVNGSSAPLTGYPGKTVLTATSVELEP
jgi:hypothetical protein